MDLKKTKNIIICGCGNIGLRHAQGLSKLKYKIDLFLIDKSKKKINFFKKNIGINKKINVVYQSNNIEKINRKIDLLIMSTDSAQRYQTLRKILRFNNIKYIILEKFVFLKEDHFKKILALKKKFG